MNVGKILVDTDVLLDVALDRAPHAASAAKLVDLLQEAPGTGFMAWHTVANFYYLVTPNRGGDTTRQFLVELSRFIPVATTDTDSLHFAATLPMRDFEDALQVAAAHACGATHIATRNTRDFRRSPIPAITPKRLVKSLA